MRGAAVAAAGFPLRGFHSTRSGNTFWPEGGIQLCFLKHALLGRAGRATSTQKLGGTLRMSFRHFTTSNREAAEQPPDFNGAVVQSLEVASGIQLAKCRFAPGGRTGLASLCRAPQRCLALPDCEPREARR
jgi:hypothetical protein